VDAEKLSTQMKLSHSRLAHRFTELRKLYGFDIKLVKPESSKKRKSGAVEEKQRAVAKDQKSDSASKKVKVAEVSAS
jgi:hypothetical protein